MLSCNNHNENKNAVNESNTEVLLKKLADTLDKIKYLDSCELISDHYYLKTVNILNTNKKYAFIVVNEYKLLLFEFNSNKWNFICAIPFESEYMGFVVQDINGDNCNDILIRSFYVYGNTSYKVLIQDCKTGKFKYNFDFDGVMNPEYDKKTGLINSFLFTGH